MNAHRPGKRWRRSLCDALRRVRRLRSRATLDARAVHALRVSLRRARLLLLIGRPLLKRSQVRKLRDRARQWLDALGPVRDCDVALEWLPRTPSARGLRRALQQFRRQQWQIARVQLQQPLPRLRLPAKHQPANALAQRWQRALSAARSHCAELICRRDTLAEAGLHDLRRRIRRWRYLLELTARKRVAGEAAAIERLVKLQEALGAAQNLTATAATLAQLPASIESRRWQVRALHQQRTAHRRALRRLAPPRGRVLPG